LARADIPEVRDLFIYFIYLHIYLSVYLFALIVSQVKYHRMVGKLMQGGLQKEGKGALMY
jgi:hypothetical protein